MNLKGYIGIYGGTFDPLHFGHLNIALQMKEIYGLDEVWFCPVQINPHKLEQIPTPFSKRLEMLQLALENVPGCSITDVEGKRPGPSYTIDTLNALTAKYPNARFCLIMGDDAIPGFFRWHQPEKIVKMVPILIGRRMASPVNIDALTGDP